MPFVPMYDTTRATHCTALQQYYDVQFPFDHFIRVFDFYISLQFSGNFKKNNFGQPILRGLTHPQCTNDIKHCNLIFQVGIRPIVVCSE